MAFRCRTCNEWINVDEGMSLAVLASHKCDEIDRQAADINKRVDDIQNGWEPETTLEERLAYAEQEARWSRTHIEASQAWLGVAEEVRQEIAKRDGVDAHTGF